MQLRHYLADIVTFEDSLDLDCSLLSPLSPIESLLPLNNYQKFMISIWVWVKFELFKRTSSSIRLKGIIKGNAPPKHPGLFFDIFLKDAYGWKLHWNIICTPLVGTSNTNRQARYQHLETARFEEFMLEYEGFNV